MIISILTSSIVAAIVLMAAFPETPTSKTIRRLLVEAPVAFLCGLQRMRLSKVALSFAALMLMVAMGPQMLLLMMSMGLDAAFVEVLILLYAASAPRHLASAWRSFRAATTRVSRIVSRPFCRGNRQRPARHRRRKSSPGRKDPSKGPEWAFA